MKKKKTDYDVEYGLTQRQAYRYGKLLLREIFSKYDGLLEDYDYCWDLDSDLDELKSLITTIVRLQSDKRLVITDLKLKKEMERQMKAMEKQIQKSQLLNNRKKQLQQKNNNDKTKV